LQIGGRLLVVTNWINQKQGEINKYGLNVVLIKLKLGLEIGERLLVVTNWINQKQGEINKYGLNVVSVKLKLGLQIGGRPLVITNWIDQKQGEIDKYDLTVVFLSSFRAPSESCAFFQGHSSRRPVDLTAVACTTSKISSAGSHTEHSWRFCKVKAQNLLLQSYACGEW
jgi:hypothetical protein